MRARVYQFARLLVLVMLVSLQPGAASPVAAPRMNELTVQYEQVRLRKLHLVRPDLIPYPISFEVYC